MKTFKEHEDIIKEGQLDINFGKLGRREKEKFLDVINGLNVKRKFKIKSITSPSLGKSVTVRAYYLDLDDLRDYLKDKGYKWKDGKMWAGKPMGITMEGKSIAEGTMKLGIFDKDLKKRKDAARRLVMFLRKKKNTKIGPIDDKQDGSNKVIDAYMSELMKYIFDDEMLDNLYPNNKNANVRANDVVVKRLKKMGVKVK
jgi:hypothetical protein